MPHSLDFGDKPMAWLTAFKCTTSKWFPPLFLHRLAWLRLALAAAAVPAALLLCGNPADAKEQRCPSGTHETWGHCCPKGSDWVFFKCVQHDEQSEERQKSPHDCPWGEELHGNTCWTIHCGIGEELRGNSCVRIDCPMGQHLVGNSCVPEDCPFGQQGTPPFCH